MTVDDLRGFLTRHDGRTAVHNVPHSDYLELRLQDTDGVQNVFDSRILEATAAGNTDARNQLLAGIKPADRTQRYFVDPERGRYHTVYPNGTRETLDIS